MFPIQEPEKGESRIFMLDQRVDAESSSFPDPARQMRPAGVHKSSVSSVGAQSIIGKTLLIKGEITGSGSVHIEGKIEGSIELPEDRVTVGRNGRVSANIAAQDIVVLGSCNASDHLDIRSEGSLYGDVVVSRISVEEGAYLTGSIDIRREPAAKARVEEQELVESLHVN
jgi:cytoskeletal protein CcmA (bactofilin family)